MARPRKPPTPRPASGFGSPPLATLEWFVLSAGGQVTLGAVQPVGTAAIAHDGQHTRVALKRQSGENLMQLLLRFDQALVRALDHDAVVDEISPRR
jgi:hypothetical protein